ncbi:unnamed protein product [Acanthoscelides obtectus]|uniref:Cyclic nucleotide-binding domain-containing protein n=1 Tax=Acanthoscelides obtectus TaxID=200917 RepID=A0A9P0L831_ACAOB|nr:unnamed protein product [Acanthoscelides obtectus]CAK1667846.1 Potassium/sodium hyperpolarization-activated cyclic nucleotide-gated channel 1 [Acanthoscelides obtectus]
MRSEARLSQRPIANFISWWLFCLPAFSPDTEINKFTIHPFSRIANFLEWFFCATRSFTYLWLPVCGLVPRQEWSPFIQFVRQVIKVSEVLTTTGFFVTGYVDSNTKDIILEAKKIALAYLKFYFTFDFLVFMGDYLLLREIMNPNEIYGVFDILANTLTHLGLVMRIRYYFVLQARCVNRLRVNRRFLALLYQLTLCTAILHLSTIYNVLVPKYAVGGDHFLPNESWISQSIGVERREVTKVYFESLMLVSCYFFGASYYTYEIKFMPEQITLSIISLIGRIYTLYLIGDMLVVFGMAAFPESRYEQFMGEVKEYMMAKNLPQDLRTRLEEYYECKMQKKFFSETKIIDTLSERLRTEMYLHFARKLIEQNNTLKTLPSTTLGVLISYMKSETFLADDVVCAVGKPTDMVFFLSAGTVAVYNKNSLELDHLYDGQDFGLDGGRRYAYVAAETSEIYYIRYKIFKSLMSEHNEVWANYEKKWAELQKRYNEIENEMESGGETILYELNRGALLEAPKTRLVIFDDL